LNKHNFVGWLVFKDLLLRIPHTTGWIP